MRFVSASAFKSAVRRKDADAADLVVRKLFISEPETVPDSDLIRFAITTSTVDREKDVVSVDGWELDNFQRNPVVLWGHNQFEPPIGRSVKLFRDGDTIKSDVKFVPADVPIYGLRAEGIRQLCQQGFLFATSVGFRPLDFKITTDEARGAQDDWFPGIDFLRQELLEFSVVSIPCNPEALIDPIVVPVVTTDDPPAPAVAAEAALAAIKLARLRRRQQGRRIALA